MKALRSLEQNLYYLHLDELDGKDVEFLQKKLKDVDDQRIFAVAEALRQGISEKKFMISQKLIYGLSIKSNI